MKKIIVAIAIAASLSSCAKLQTVYSAIITSNVPPKAIYVAINSFDAAKATATNYLRMCAPNPAPSICDDKLIRTKLVPAIQKGTVARDDLRALVKSHPGELGPVGTYQLLVTSTNVISEVVKD